MIYTLRFSFQAEKVAKKWKKSNPVVFKKYSKILAELIQHPKTGLGHPEALIGGKSVTWARHGHTEQVWWSAAYAVECQLQ